MFRFAPRVSRGLQSRARFSNVWATTAGQEVTELGGRKSPRPERPPLMRAAVELGGLAQDPHDLGAAPGACSLRRAAPVGQRDLLALELSLLAALHAVGLVLSHRSTPFPRNLEHTFEIARVRSSHCSRLSLGFKHPQARSPGELGDQPAAGRSPQAPSSSPSSSRSSFSRPRVKACIRSMARAET